MLGFWLLLGLLAAQNSPADPAPRSSSCPGDTTIALNGCAQRDVASAEERMLLYLDAAKARLFEQDRSELVPLIDASQTSWAAYARNECRAVYEDWKDGTIRGLMAADCQRRLTDARTHTIWNNWLRYMDSTPPVLPEPEPSS